jgi:hypothetical protein
MSPDNQTLLINMILYIAVIQLLFVFLVI